jgi:hypothetical protein
VPVLHSVSDICPYYPDPQVTTSGEFKTGPLYVPTTFVVQMLKLRAVHIYRTHGNSEYQLARFVYSVLLYTIALHIVFSTVLTIKYDMGTQQFHGLCPSYVLKFKTRHFRKISLRLQTCFFQNKMLLHSNVYILIKHELPYILESNPH